MKNIKIIKASTKVIIIENSTDIFDGLNDFFGQKLVSFYNLYPNTDIVRYAYCVKPENINIEDFYNKIKEYCIEYQIRFETSNIIPIVVKTAIVEKRKKINLKILSTFLLASNLTDNLLRVTDKKVIDKIINEPNAISRP